MLERLMLEDFEALKGQTFAAHVEGVPPLTFELVSVTGGRIDARRPSHLRRPYSLVFRGPLTPELPQGTFELEHEKIGRQGIFIVPIKRDAVGMYYEAVFA